jgi:hypothetical protein
MKAKFSCTASIALLVAACDPTGSSMIGSDMDPLRPPAGVRNGLDTSSDPILPGQFVMAAVNNTAFYKNKPEESQNADSLLAYGTQMKIITISGNHAKVELDSGEVGYVPTVMLATNGLAPLDEQPPIMPLEGDVPLPVIDPSAPAADSTLPPVIDPDAVPAE